MINNHGFIVTLAVCLFTGCASAPERPLANPALDYPYATLADVQMGHRLVYEGTRKLDGGSRVFVFSTNEKKRIELWEMDSIAKLEYGFSQLSNAFQLRVEDGKGFERVIIPNTKLERILISSLEASPQTPASIIEGIKNRKKPIPEIK